MTLSFFFKLSNHALVLWGSVKVTDRSQPCKDITACTGFEIWREDCHKTGSSHKDRPRKFLPVKCAAPLARPVFGAAEVHRRVGALSQRDGALTVTTTGILPHSHRAVRQRDGALREGLVMGVVLSMSRGSALDEEGLCPQMAIRRSSVG